MSLLPPDPAHGGVHRICDCAWCVHRICDGGGQGGCGEPVNAVEGYLHCDVCKSNSCQTCIGTDQVYSLPLCLFSV